MKDRCDIVRVLSILEPWASLIEEKVKYIETRSFKTNYRGELYIHASKKKVSMKNELSLELVSLLKKKEFQYGTIIAKCKLVDCIYMDETFLKEIEKKPIEKLCGEYRVGRYAWVLSNIEPLDEYIEAKGSLGIWYYNEKRK